MANYMNRKRKPPTAAQLRAVEERNAGRNKSEAQARERANTLVRHLVLGGWGNRWRPRVWENLGWHYSVTPFARPHTGTELEIHPSNDHEPLGACWVSFIPNGGAQIHVNADNPAAALDAIRERILDIKRCWETCFKNVKPVTDKGVRHR